MNLQVSYYRNIHTSHMVLMPALEGETWEKEMLWRNRPKGLLLPECNSRNGQSQLWYDITGKQAVDMLAELSDIAKQNAAVTQEVSANTNLVSENFKQVEGSTEGLKSIADGLEESMQHFSV